MSNAVPDPQIQTAVETLQYGGIIAYPTEAVYGLGCDPTNEAALKKLIALKQRDANKGLILIASDIKQLYPFIAVKYFDLHPNIKKQWPGPVTWVIPCKASTPTLLTGNRNTLAVRVSSHPVVQQLCKQFGGAIVSTSANQSGLTPCKTAKDIQTHFNQKIDCIIDAPLGNAKKPSAIFFAETGEQLR